MSTFNFDTPPLAASAASASSYVLRALPGGIDFIQFNSGSTPGYLMLHDRATAPSNGATTPVLVWQVPANSTIAQGFDPPLQMATGGVLTYSTTGPVTLTLSATGWFGGRIR